MVVMKGKRHNSLYSLLGKTIMSYVDASYVTEIDYMRLWHLQLGHISHESLDVLYEQGVLGKDMVDKINFVSTISLKNRINQS